MRCDRRLGGAVGAARERGEPASGRLQLGHRPLLGHAAAVQHVDVVSVLDHRVPMSNDEGGRSIRALQQGGADLLLGRIVEIGRRLIEDQQAWPPHQCARDLQPLALSQR